MRVLVACEESQVVCKAFRALGHEAYSCDVIDCSGGHPEWHIKDDVLKHLNDGWDLMIAHPPCTFLAVSGSAWLNSPLYPNRRNDQRLGFEFFMNLATAPIRHIAVENPVCVVSSMWRKPDQIIQPYMFGDEASKPTCLWLKNLPKLRYGEETQMAFGEQKPPQSKVVGKGEFVTSSSGRRGAKWNWWLPPGPERQKIRSKTFQGIANAMATQWSSYILEEGK
jgi:hypothetical protein